MKLNYNIFLDDLRMPKDVFAHTSLVEYLDNKWEIVRSYDEFVDLIANNFVHGGLPRLISLDHDLSPEHYILTEKNGDEFDEKATKIQTGYHALEWYYKFCESEDIVPAKILVHYENAGGKRNIFDLIKENQYKRGLQNGNSK